MLPPRTHNDAYTPVPSLIELVPYEDSVHDVEMIESKACSKMTGIMAAEQIAVSKKHTSP